RSVPRRLDVVKRYVRKPEEVVGESRSDAAARLRMPPVQHVAALELVRSVQKDLVPWYLWADGRQRAGILQLIAEAEGAAGLIEGAPSPEAAAQILIHEPSVEHQVDGGRGAFHAEDGRNVAPERAHVLEGGIDAVGRAEIVQAPGQIVDILHLADHEDHLGRSTRGHLERSQEGRTGIGHGAGPAV